MKKYLYTFVGIAVFFILLFILNHFEEIIMNWAKQNYEFTTADLYISIIKMIILPLAVISLCANHILSASKFDWKLFFIFFILGALLLYKLLFYMPIPIVYKLIIAKYSDIGGVIIGLGVIVSIKNDK